MKILSVLATFSQLWKRLKIAKIVLSTFLHIGSYRRDKTSFESNKLKLLSARIRIVIFCFQIYPELAILGSKFKKGSYLSYKGYLSIPNQQRNTSMWCKSMVDDDLRNIFYSNRFYLCIWTENIGWKAVQRGFQAIKHRN